MTPCEQLLWIIGGWLIEAMLSCSGAWTGLYLRTSMVVVGAEVGAVVVLLVVAVLAIVGVAVVAAGITKANTYFGTTLAFQYCLLF